MGTLFRSDTPRPPRAAAEGATAPADGASKVQDALAAVDQATLAAGEAGTARYGASTAAGVAYRGLPAPGPAKRH